MSAEHVSDLALFLFRAGKTVESGDIQTSFQSSDMPNIRQVAMRQIYMYLLALSVMLLACFLVLVLVLLPVVCTVFIA